MIVMLLTEHHFEFLRLKGGCRGSPASTLVKAPATSIIFQISLDSGTVPLDWKKDQVCPLFKKGDKTDPANYRPISLTCILCKTMEHIIASNLCKHFNRNNILYVGLPAETTSVMYVEMAV